MCINPTAEDFTTIHHELGHNFYQRAYMKQPVILRDSANDGFHEAIGDTIALSVTPEYLVKIGLLDAAPDASRDTGLLLRMALERFAFLPFAPGHRPVALEGVFRRGDAGRLQQGVVGSPARSIRASRRRRRRARSSSTRAPKYHVPDNTPYTRYFLARHPAVPVPPRALEDGRLHHAAAPLLDLRKQGGRAAPERHAVDGHVAAVAGRARKR